MMTTESSIDSPPNKFYISSNENDGTQWNGSNGYTKKCNLCNLSKKSFHCRECLQIGDFIYSKSGQLSSTSSERFDQKQKRYFDLKSKHNTMEIKCKQMLEQSIHMENLKSKIIRKKERIYHLNKLINETKVNLNIFKTDEKVMTKGNFDTRKNFSIFANNMMKLDRIVRDRLNDNKNLIASHKNVEEKLKQLIRNNIVKLIKYIFPIMQSDIRLEELSTVKTGRTTVTSSSASSSSSSSLPADTVIALAEATHTAYIKGQWILQSSQNDTQHVIVAATLPDNGDYTAYNDWVSTKKEGLHTGTGSIVQLPSKNPAYSISAALTYATQLISILSYYLDIRLPYKMVYGDFCKKELSEQSFTRKVARLNANILYLCYTQYVNLSQLSPNHTLENIQKLLNTNVSDLGRNGAVQTTGSLIVACDSQLIQDLLSGDDSDGDDDNSFQNDWESVPHPLPLDINVSTTSQQYYNQQQQHQQVTSMAAATGLVTSAVASVASLWRGWTTGR